MSSGTIEVSVLGPGTGDVWGYDWLDVGSNGSADLHAVIAEGQVKARLAPGGLQEVTLVVTAHPAFWVVGSITGVMQHPVDLASFALSDESLIRGFPGLVQAWLELPKVVATGRFERLAPPRHPPIGSGPVIELTQVEVSDWVGGDSFLARAADLQATRLVVAVGWHRTLVVDLGLPPRGGIVDVGVLRTEAAGFLVVHVLDASTHQEVEGAVPSAECRDGGHASAPLAPERLADSRTWIMATDRSSGTCELRAEAAGYQPLIRTIELAPFLDLELDLLLERVPR